MIQSGLNKLLLNLFFQSQYMKKISIKVYITQTLSPADWAALNNEDIISKIYPKLQDSR